MAEWERSPWGPWTDYGRPICGAEEAVSAVIDQILTDGGTLLWQKYLERKAFTFAASAITEALVSRLRMCYVHHDRGESADFDEESWSIEDEPEPGEIDSWARMHLPVRRQAPHEGAAKSRFASSRRNPGSRGRPNSMGQSLQKEKEKPSERSTPLELDYHMDAEEERLREAKAREAADKKEKEKKAKEAGKTEEEERKRVQQRHEEMSKRPHTFDTEGNLIWVVDDFRPDCLPPLQQAFGFIVKKDPRAPRETQDLSKTLGATGLAPTTPEDGRKKSKKRRNDTQKKPAVEPEFTDGFSKLQHGQPPILETMMVQSGVILESMGKRKPGPEPDGERFMSRREYVQLAEREVAMDGGYQPNFGGGAGRGGGGDAGGGGAGGGGGGAAGGGGGAGAGPGAHAGGGVGGDGGAAQAGAASPSVPAGAGAAEGNTLSSAAIAAQMEAAGKAGLSPGLPPIPAGRGIAGNAGQGGGPAYPGGPSVVGGPPADRGDGAPPQKAPRAPPQFTRNKKFEALGFVRPPRYHVPQLGGPQGFGSAQPPLGATMGHGLIRSGSHKEAYFFPPSIPDLPTNLLRSSSDTVIGSRQGSARGANSARKLQRDMSSADKGDAEGVFDEEDGGGRLRAEMSPAYRHFKAALMPAEGSGGFSVSGTLRR
eukprot:TRINITY_DN74598_c0_g1_i1.p1 TRINITY_DN74598_c0_g1~~TRINITY_DN74598_c0_g1_i1.p1  ORF type:complete len:682 (+),score=148.53 TRINITY_DN74598_c0_g1_i1:88-2046(+)